MQNQAMAEDSQGKRILVTGATGFIGQSLCEYLAESGLKLTACCRTMPEVSFDSGIDSIETGDLTAETDYTLWLENIDCVIHLSGRAHVMHSEDKFQALERFRQENVAVTKNLVKQCVEQGVRRFIYISSIKVHGEYSIQPFKADDPVQPEDPYAISKLEAEQSLISRCLSSEMEYVIIRPPLVYGPGVKGNFSRLIQLLNKPFPLPFGSIHNQRSLVNLQNLNHFIYCCIDHPDARNEVFLVSDGQDLSTTELIKLIRRYQPGKARLIKFPEPVLFWLGKILSKEAEIQRLCGCLQVDITKNKQLLDWEPVVSVNQAIQQMLVPVFHEDNQ